MSNIIVLKVKKTNVGKIVPWDKIYFVKPEHEQLISKLFDYALVFPANASLLNDFVSLKPHEVSHLKQDRDDSTLKTKITSERWAEIVKDLNTRLVVIPVLTSRLKGKISPRYLASKRWTEKVQGRRRRYVTVVNNPRGPAIHESGYLSTPLPAPDDKVAPICSICPRQLLQLQGECQPGQPICLSSLDFMAITTSTPIDMSDEGNDEENPFLPYEQEQELEDGSV